MPSYARRQGQVRHNRSGAAPQVRPYGILYEKGGSVGMRQLLKEVTAGRPPLYAPAHGRPPKPAGHKELEALLPEIFDAAVALVGASSGSLWRMDAGGRLRIVLAYNLPHDLEGAHSSSERWKALAPADDQQLFLLPAPGEATLATSTQIRNGHQTGGRALCVALAFQGQLLGLLNLNLPGPLDGELEPCCRLALRALAGQAAAALHCLQLQRMVREGKRRVMALRRAAIEAREEERQRLRIEVHDRVAQSLAPALYYLQAYEKVARAAEEGPRLAAKAQRFVQEAMREARQIISDLRPPALEALGLATALRLDLEELGEEMGWQVELELADLRLPRDMELTLYRIAHEALVNARKHARSERVALRLWAAVEDVVLEIQDFGVGFEPDVQLRSGDGRGVGLSSMRQRAALLDGCCEVISSPGTGTLVRVTIPRLGEEEERWSR